MKEKDEFIIVIVLIIATIGSLFAIIGNIISTVAIMKENTSEGIIRILLDLALLVFISWAVIEGVIKPLKRYERKD